MPKPYPEGSAAMSLPWNANAKRRWSRSRQISGSEETCLKNWWRKADIEDGTRPGLTRDESDELRESRKTYPAARTGGGGDAPGGGLPVMRCQPK